MNGNNLLNQIDKIPQNKKLIIFDLDGTLTDSKAEIDPEMAILLGGLLKIKRVGVVGGGAFERFKIQIIDRLSQDVRLENLFLLPLNGGSFYQRQNGEWQKIYSQKLSDEEKEKTKGSLERVIKEADYVQPERVYGEQIEDRGGQITFSALGQNAPLDEKTKWSKEHDADRLRMAMKLQEYLPDMEVKTAGLTSIDITRKGIDKKFAIEKLTDYLNIPIVDTLFIGDAFGPDDNDSPALESGVLCFKVKKTEETKNLIRHLLSE